MSTINFVEGDGQPYITVTLTDLNGATIDLSGTTPLLTVQNRLGQVPIISSAAMTPLDQGTARGQAVYQADPSEISAPGFYLWQVYVNIAGGGMTFPNDGTDELLVISEKLQGTPAAQPATFQPASLTDLASYDTHRLARVRAAVRDPGVAMEPSIYQPTLTLGSPGGASQIPGAILNMVNADASDTGKPLRILGGYGMAYGTSGIDVTQIRPRHCTGDTLGFPGYSVTFAMGGDDRFGIKFKETANISFRLWIDEHLVTTYTSVGAGMTLYPEGEVQLSGNSGALYEVMVSGLDTDAHTYRVECVGGLWFGGIYTKPITGLYRVRRPALKAVLLSDSTGAGANSPGTGGGSQVSVWWRRCCDLMGWEYFNASIGGTGFTVPGSAVVFEDRVAADVVSVNPDVVVVAGSRNDHVSTLAATQSAAESCHAAIKAALPHALLLAVGAWTGTSRTQDYLDANTAALNAALASSVPFVDLYSGLTYDQAGNILIQGSQFVTGTGKNTAPAGDGNADWMMGTDAVHPTLAGHAAWARHAANSFRAIIDALPQGALL